MLTTVPYTDAAGIKNLEWDAVSWSRKTLYSDSRSKLLIKISNHELNLSEMII